MIKFLTVAILAVGLFVGCTDKEQGSETQNVGVQLPTGFHIGETAESVPLISPDCWEWFPVGDGVAWSIASPQGEDLYTFPIEKIEDGHAFIANLGPIAAGQFVLAEYEPQMLQPIFKVQQVDPAKGILVAIVGDIEGSCSPVESGAEAKANAPYTLAKFSW
jgi:hypothetical protein